jgi:hypothetical protein
MSLGPHTFTLRSTDNVGNSAASSVAFSIIATVDSIKDDVRQFLQRGDIKKRVLATAYLVELNLAGAARAQGRCSIANAIYQAFIKELQAQSGKNVTAAAAAIMILDAQYLISHCP